MGFIFSSPGLKGHVSFCHHFASVVVVVVVVGVVGVVGVVVRVC